MSQSATEYAELLMVLAGSYRIGFGDPADIAKATALDFEAARLGSNLGRIKVLTYSLLEGLEVPITRDEKATWLEEAVSEMFFAGEPDPDKVLRRTRFNDGLRSIQGDKLEDCLLFTFIKACLTQWEVLNGEFDGAAEDPLFSLVVNGDLAGLKSALTADPTSLDTKKDGFTLLHVATDHCQESIIRGQYIHRTYSLYC